MSKFTDHSKERVQKLEFYLKGLLADEKGIDLLKRYQILDTQFIPADIIEAFDILVSENADIEGLKTASNKLFNLLYRLLSEYKPIKPKRNSLIYFIGKHHKAVKDLLNRSKVLIKELNRQYAPETAAALKTEFEKLLEIDRYYAIKENIIFPELEKKWEHYRCVSLMWAFHDDIRKNIKKSLEVLNHKVLDLEAFNLFSSKVFFNLNTIIFREENVLFPLMLETFDQTDWDKMLIQTAEMELPFVEIPKRVIPQPQKTISDYKINLKTGVLSIEQLELIFSHLPVDITFVDESETVKYFSTPKHRIFPRSTGIIGRKVQDCHPHDSVEVVNKIVQSFIRGEKDVASFWIKMGHKFVLIQYFAVRNDQNRFKGVLEVSQEISEIQSLTGERRLLDW